MYLLNTYLIQCINDPSYVSPKVIFSRNNFFFNLTRSHLKNYQLKRNQTFAVSYRFISEQCEGLLPYLGLKLAMKSIREENNVALI